MHTRQRFRLSGSASGAAVSGSEIGFPADTIVLPSGVPVSAPVPRTASLNLAPSRDSSSIGTYSGSGSGTGVTKRVKDASTLTGPGSLGKQSQLSTTSRASKKLIAVSSMNHLFQNFFHDKHGDAINSESESGTSEHSEQLAPPREFTRYLMYVNGIVLLVLVLLLPWAIYSTTAKIIRMNAWYAIEVVALIPLGIYFFSFAVSTGIRGLMSLGFGATNIMDRNSQNYSAIKTPIPKGARLPQIVVQMPVYKESLEEVIKLTYYNVRRAMDYYTKHGGRVKFIVCDDGLQVIPVDEAVPRGEFYHEHNIAMVARPAQNRRGVFKKASNLNYQLAVSERINQLMREDENVTAEQALLAVWDEYGREFVAAGDLSLDDDCLILLIDADTKVPEACMYDVVGEFIVDSHIAYTQHLTTPFAEQNRNYWEQYVSAFTRMIYYQGIAISTAFGDGAPLVGHNAFLRFSSLRKVAYRDETCRANEIKYWSECHVSEDFDMYTRLASVGSFGRYVTYTGPEFQEGVSLCYVDEIIKFKKFTYGACEMLFNPFKDWLFHGPFSKGFITYVTAKDIYWYHKVGMLTYLSSYLAMAAAFYFCMLEGIMSVWDPGFHDYFMIRSFDVMLTCTVIFSGIGTFCGGIVYQWRRTGARRNANVFKIVWNEIKWIPVLVFFFCGSLFYMTEAAAMYFFSMKAVWGATAKETTNTTCWQALRDTLWGHKWEYLLYCTTFVGYFICTWYYNIGVYRAWAVMSYMIAHICAPIVLNPCITSLAW